MWKTLTDIATSLTLSEDKRQRAWRVMMPAPKFMAPTPEITKVEEHEWQWWHIPVSMERKFPRRDIPGCRVSVAFLEGQYTGREFPFRWRSDLRSGSSETSLIFGASRKIPLVVRKDNSPTAMLTDHDCLMRNVGDYVIPTLAGKNVILTFAHYYNEAENHNLDPGRHKLILKIKSGDLCWESKPYEIHVPDAGAGNSHFNVVESEG